MLEKIKGFKTIAFNIIMSVIMMLTLWSPESDLPTGDQVQGALTGLEEALTLIWGVGNLILRAVTNSSIFKKE